MAKRYGETLLRQKKSNKKENMQMNDKLNKRFELWSFNFHNLNAIIYDNLEEKQLPLTIYEIVELLNEVSQSEYDLLKLRDDICKKLDDVVD